MTRTIIFYWLFVLISIFGVIYANHRSDEGHQQYERMCNNTKSDIGRMHMSRCMVQFAPKPFLIMIEYCKKIVFGHVKFDQVLIAYCDRKKHDLISKWFKCQTDYARDKNKKTIRDMYLDDDAKKFLKLVRKCITMDLKDYE